MSTARPPEGAQHRSPQGGGTTVGIGGRLYDPTVLDALFGNDTAVVAAVLGTFITSMESLIDDLQSASLCADPVAVASAGHRIRGAAAMSGAIALAESAAVLEQDAMANDPARCALAAAEVMRRWQATLTDPAFRRATAAGGEDGQ